jgi:hypothetical protein
MTTREYLEAYWDDSENVRSWPVQDAQEPLPNVRTVTTVNSVYQINEADHMIRRLSGTADPTPRQGLDGAWKPYRTLGVMLDGLLIVWGDNPDGSAASTWTSKVLADTSEATAKELIKKELT